MERIGWMDGWMLLRGGPAFALCLNLEMAPLLERARRSAAATYTCGSDGTERTGGRSVGVGRKGKIELEYERVGQSLTGIIHVYICHLSVSLSYLKKLEFTISENK